MSKQKLTLEGMHCTSCAMNIEGTLEDLDGVREANVNFAKQFVEVIFDEQKVSLNDLIAAVQGAGYQATPA